MRPTDRELGWIYSNLDEIDERGNMVCHKFLSTLSAPHPKTHIFTCLGADMFVLPSASLISRKAFTLAASTSGFRATRTTICSCACSGRDTKTCTWTGRSRNNGFIRPAPHTLSGWRAAA